MLHRQVCFNCSTEPHHLPKLLDAYSMHLYGFLLSHREVDVASPLGRVLALYGDEFSVCQPLAVMKRQYWVKDDFMVVRTRAPDVWCVWCL